MKQPLGFMYKGPTWRPNRAGPQGHTSLPGITQPVFAQDTVGESDSWNPGSTTILIPPFVKLQVSLKLTVGLIQDKLGSLTFPSWSYPAADPSLPTPPWTRSNWVFSRHLEETKCSNPPEAAVNTTLNP